MSAADELRQRALIGVLGARATNPAGGVNPNRPEPATVATYAGFPSRMASVYGDQPGSTSMDAFPAENMTPYPLSSGSRVLVLFYEPKGVVIIGVESSPIVGFIGDASQSVPDGGGSTSPIGFVASYDPEGFLTGPGVFTIPPGRTGIYSVMLATQGPDMAYTRLFTEIVDTGPGRTYRSGGTEFSQTVCPTLLLEGGSVLDTACYQQSGGAQTLGSHIELLLISDDLTGV